MLIQYQARILWCMMFIDSLQCCWLWDLNTLSRRVLMKKELILMKMMMMSENKADHKSMWQWFWVLTKQWSGLSLNRPPCPPNERGGSHHTWVIWWSTRTHNWPRRDSHPPDPSGPFIKNRVTFNACKFNPISTTWLRDTLYTCDGFSAICYFPLLFKIGNGNVTIQGFIK
jgi:hypothetical protein